MLSQVAAGFGSAVPQFPLRAWLPPPGQLPWTFSAQRMPRVVCNPFVFCSFSAQIKDVSQEINIKMLQQACGFALIFLDAFFSADFDPCRAKASQSLVCSEVVGQGWMPRCVFSLEMRGFGNPVLFGNCLEARSSSGAAWCLGTAVTRDDAQSHCRAPALLTSPWDLP